MPAKCTVCNHAHRGAIEFAMISKSMSYSQISQRFRVHYDCLKRHKANGHISDATVREMVPVQWAGGETVENLKKREPENMFLSLLDQRSKLYRWQDKAERAGQLSICSMLSGRLHENFKIVGSLLGEFTKHVEIEHKHLHVNPEWLKIRGDLLRALRKYPEAHADVLAVLEAHEAPPQPQKMIDVTPQ